MSTTAERNPERDRLHQRRHYLRKKYGVTLEWFEQKLAEQDGRCAICRSADPGAWPWQDFVVDHDHHTGEVRGLLCSYCNTAIGQFKDDPDNTQRATNYLLFYRRRRMEVAESV